MRGRAGIPGGTARLQPDVTQAEDSRRVSFERYGEVAAGRRSTMLTGTCPQCGAAWQPTSTGHCTSCGVNPTVDVGAWGTWEVSIGIPAGHVTGG